MEPPYLINPDPVGAFVMYPICSSEIFKSLAKSSLSLADWFNITMNSEFDNILVPC